MNTPLQPLRGSIKLLWSRFLNAGIVFSFFAIKCIKPCIFKLKIKKNSPPDSTPIRAKPPSTRPYLVVFVSSQSTTAGIEVKGVKMNSGKTRIMFWKIQQTKSLVSARRELAVSRSCALVVRNLCINDPVLWHIDYVRFELCRYFVCRETNPYYRWYKWAFGHFYRASAYSLLCRAWEPCTSYGWDD